MALLPTGWGVFPWRPIPKDTSHSCIFEFPDGPPHPEPPPPVPTDPPDCYPYCQSDDWPPFPFPPPSPPPLPPGFIGHGFSTYITTNGEQRGGLAPTLDQSFRVDIKDQSDNQIGNLLLITDFTFGTNYSNYIPVDADDTNFVARVESHIPAAFPGTSPWTRFQNLSGVRLLAQYPLPLLYKIRIRITQNRPVDGNIFTGICGVSLFRQNASQINIQQIYYENTFLTGLQLYVYDFDLMIYFYETGYAASYCTVNGTQIMPVVTNF